MDFKKPLEIDDGIILIYAIMCTAITDIVFCTCSDISPVNNRNKQIIDIELLKYGNSNNIHGILINISDHIIIPSCQVRHTLSSFLWNITLQTGDNFCHLLNNLCVFTVTLITTAPPRISTNLSLTQQAIKETD